MPLGQRMWKVPLGQWKGKRHEAVNEGNAARVVDEEIVRRATDEGA